MLMLGAASFPNIFVFMWWKYTPYTLPHCYYLASLARKFCNESSCLLPLTRNAKLKLFNKQNTLDFKDQLSSPQK